jgi:hypothetical protein
MRVLLITPPLVQLNTPYPATTVLTGFLESRGIRAAQVDLSLELALRLFSREGLRKVAKEAVRRSESVRHFLEHDRLYAETVDAVIRFLQGRNPKLAAKIVSRRFLPEGPRFGVLDYLSYDSLGMRDQAKYLASLYVDDIADAIRDGVDARFELSRYAEKLAVSAPTFDPIRRELERKKTTLIDRMLDQLAKETLKKHRPDVVGLTVPFPGNLYGALRIARMIRRVLPRTKIVLGGGYVNTELRELSDPRVFDYVDFVTLDNGEAPFLQILQNPDHLLRTFVRKHGRVVFETLGPASVPADIPHCEIGTPSFRGLKLDRYISLCEMLNPMHRLWSDGRWNKLMLAHGCYWRKCAFCDTSLDYIRRFDPASADVLVDRIQAVARQTGERGFHFTDEAVPPGLLRALSQRLIARRVKINWWCNIRFDLTLTPELARLMARAGCIAVTAGLETACNRTLRLMRKGVTVEQAVAGAKAFAEAGILVHAYLMYGFPTQTAQELVDALERVRQLFAAGWIQSAYWHRFALTVHSPMARDPKRFGVRLLRTPRATFARNEIPFKPLAGGDPARFGPGLRKALYNYMHGLGLDEDARVWFDFGVPGATVRRDWSASCKR